MLVRFYIVNLFFAQLIPHRRGLEAGRESLDETRAVLGVEPARLVHAHQVLVVERQGRRATATDDVALVQAQVDAASDVLLWLHDRVHDELHLRTEPVTVVHKLAELDAQGVAQALHFSVDAERLEVLCHVHALRESASKRWGERVFR